MFNIFFIASIFLWMQMSKSIDVFLLLPLTAYSGFELTIFWTEFNRVSAWFHFCSFILSFFNRAFLFATKELCQLHCQCEIHWSNKYYIWHLCFNNVTHTWHLYQVHISVAIHSFHAHGIDLQWNIHAYNHTRSTQHQCHNFHSCSILNLNILFERANQIWWKPLKNVKNGWKQFRNSFFYKTSTIPKTVWFLYYGTKKVYISLRSSKGR